MGSCAPKTVAIIGAGPSGLVAAKNMLATGFQVTVFDISPAIGGMWNPECHRSWDSLKTNVSCFTTAFSDFPWPESTSVFPSQADMANYLKSYASTFVPDSCLRLRTTVTSVRHAEAHSAARIKAWRVEWLSVSTTGASRGETQAANSGAHVQVDFFDNVIVATGFFSSPYIPSTLHTQMQTFQGTRLHSGEYRSAEAFRDKSRVVIVGSSFSAAEIAAEVCLQTRHVIHVVSTPFWALPRFIPMSPDDEGSPFLPVDAVVFARTGRASFQETVIKSQEENAAVNAFFGKICGRDLNAGHEHVQDFEPPPSEAARTLPQFLTISDDYMPCVRSGRIAVQMGRVKAATGLTVTLEDGSSIEDVDGLILCTGFRPTLPFLASEILNALAFDQDDPFCPLLLHKATFPPAPCPPGLAFVGMHRGTYFLTAELQSMWVAKVFASDDGVIPPDELEKGVAVERRIRDQNPRPQFPHGDYVGFACSLAEEVGLLHVAEGLDLAERRSHFMPADLCPRNWTSFEHLNAELARCMSGKMVAGAAFRALAGRWTVRRDAEPVIAVATVTFCLGNNVDTLEAQYLHPEPNRQDSGSGAHTEANEGPTVIGASFVRGWRYDRTRDELAVAVAVNRAWDPPGAGSSESELVYHALRFLAPSSPEYTEEFQDFRDTDSGWRAVSEWRPTECLGPAGAGSEAPAAANLCLLFKFAGILLKSVQILSGGVECRGTIRTTFIPFHTDTPVTNSKFETRAP